MDTVKMNQPMLDGNKCPQCGTPLPASALCGLTTPAGRAQDIDSFAPVVVKTVPEAGSKDVPPGEYEVKITFSKEMTDQPHGAGVRPGRIPIRNRWPSRITKPTIKPA